jgi:LacI family transcriptional regulator
MICQSNETHTTEVANIQKLMTNWIDGLLICHSLDTSSFEHIKLQITKGKPLIHFYRVCMDTATSKVIVEDRKGAEVIMEHLVQQGCTRIAIIVGSPHLLITTKKLQGYRHILKRYDYPFEKDSWPIPILKKQPSTKW